VPETPRTSPLDLLEVLTRAEHARHIATGFPLTTPALADLRCRVGDALSDIPALAAEVSRLREGLIACRLNRANLAAVGRLTVAAYENGEPDPLAYLRDELRAQGFDRSEEHREGM
jgi:hypothetical protein